MLYRDTRTILHIPHSPALLLTFSTLVLTLSVFCSPRFLQVKFRMLLSCLLPPPYSVTHSLICSHVLTFTQIKLALDEVAAEGKEVIFKRDVYADIYVDIIGLMAKCDTTPIHRAKTKALRVHWAKIGR